MTKDYLTQIQRISQQFFQRSAVKTQLIQQKIKQAIVQGSIIEQDLDHIEFELHSLAGSAGTLGWQQVSEIASTALSCLQQIKQKPHCSNDLATEPQTSQRAIPQQDQDWNQLQQLSENLCQQAQHPPDAKIQTAKTSEPSNTKKVYLVDDDQTLLTMLSDHLKQSGFETSEFNSTAEFLQQDLNQEQPDLIIMDIQFPSGQADGNQALYQIRRKYGPQLPIIMFSKSDDMEARLAAHRAKANAFIIKPCEISQVCQIVQELCDNTPEQAYRVLIVDDIRITREFYGATLEAADMEVMSIGDPMQTLTAIREFSPDVIFLDVYMPSANGTEVAAVIRQDERLNWLPIVFLSSENDINKQNDALTTGGDDFLSKPVDADVLVKLTRNWAWRSRHRKSRISQPSLF